MTKRGGWRHTSHTKERIAAKSRARWDDPAERARVSEETKVRMAAPAVRQRIRDGMARAAGITEDLQLLRRARRDASPEARKRFLDEILSPVCTASAPNGAGVAG